MIYWEPIDSKLVQQYFQTYFAPGDTFVSSTPSPRFGNCFCTIATSTKPKTPPLKGRARGSLARPGRGGRGVVAATWG